MKIKRVLVTLLVLLTLFSSSVCSAYPGEDPDYDYVPAPGCGVNCGVSICAIAAAVAIVAGIGALIISTGDTTNTHAH